MNKNKKRKFQRPKHYTPVVQWAKNELDLLQELDGDAIQAEMNRDILDVVTLVDAQGHTGLYASYLLSTTLRLINGMPLTPLTGEDDEWALYDHNGEHIIEYNRRWPCVKRIQGDNSTAINDRARMVSEDGGKTFKSESAPVTFPYTVPSQAEKVIRDTPANLNAEAEAPQEG